jgi:hypothetical protein
MRSTQPTKGIGAPDCRGVDIFACFFVFEDGISVQYRHSEDE